MMHLLFATVGQPCSFPSGASEFLGFPHWYQYLSGVTDTSGVCNPQLNNLNDTWLIVAAVLEILLRVAALLAVAFVIYGGFGYMTSQGEPDKTAKARHTIINALIGLGLSIAAAAIVTFIAGSVN